MTSRVDLPLLVVICSSPSTARANRSSSAWIIVKSESGMKATTRGVEWFYRLWIPARVGAGSMGGKDGRCACLMDFWAGTRGARTRLRFVENGRGLRIIVDLRALVACCLVTGSKVRSAGRCCAGN